MEERTGENVSARELIGLLKDRNLTLTTTESLTGGLVAAMLTDVPGASAVFRQGFVTYCNEAKNHLLHVKKSTLDAYGAVSAETAREMAENGAQITGSDICISLTGLAGPSSEEGKPVGLVYIGCCCKGKVTVRECRFSGSRSAVRTSAAEYALKLVRECVTAG